MYRPTFLLLLFIHFSAPYHPHQENKIYINAFQSSALKFYLCVILRQFFLVCPHFSAVSTQMALSRLSIQMGFRKQDMQMEESE